MSDSPSTAVIEEQKQDSIYWMGPYLQKNKEELVAYQYCIVDGWGWTHAADGSVYCAGPVAKIKQHLAGQGIDAPETHRPRVTEVGQKSETGETAIPKDGEGVDNTFVPPRKPLEKPKMGRPKKEISDTLAEKVKTLTDQGLGSRQIADKLSEGEDGVKVSYKIVQRIQVGQKVLV